MNTTNLKGLLEFFVLTAIPAQYMYGKEIQEKLSSLIGTEISEGTLYPLLNRLKKAKLIESHINESDVGPVRKYYELTTTGKKRLEELNTEWNKMNSNLHRLRRKSSRDR